MPIEKHYIKNRKGERLAVVLENPEGARGLAFIMHGLGGFKEQSHIEVIARTFTHHGFSVVRFDTTNTFGESDGAYEHASVTNYYEDLEDIIEWSRGKHWFSEPFVLSGHSLGGLCVALYAEKYPERVLALVPISAVVSGQLVFNTLRYRISQPLWKLKGYISQRDGFLKRKSHRKLRYSFIADGLQYDLLPEVHRLSMPVLLIVGQYDKTTPLSHQQIFFRALPPPKELHVIAGAPHTFRKPEHLAELQRLIAAWIRQSLS